MISKSARKSFLLAILLRSVFDARGPVPCLRLIFPFDFSDLRERNIIDRVLLPILKIEVPPFVWVDGKAGDLHHTAEHVAVSAFLVGAAFVIGRRTLGKLV